MLLNFLLMCLTRLTNLAPTYLRVQQRTQDLHSYGKKIFVYWSILAKATLCQSTKTLLDYLKQVEKGTFTSLSNEFTNQHSWATS